MTGNRAVERARALVGSRFRPQGRDPETGLDCVGLVLAAFAIAPDAVRRDYRLRGNHRAELQRELALHFMRRKADRCDIGDLMLCSVAAEQLHLAINCGDSFVHADARLGRIVETPGPPPWPVLSTHRRRSPPARRP